MAYLTALGDADVGHKVTPLPADRKEAFLGKYASEETDVRLECRVNKNGQLTIEIQQAEAEPASRFNIYYVGDDEFFPSGVPSVRLRFAVEDGKAKSVSVRGTDPVLTAKRIGV